MKYLENKLVDFTPLFKIDYKHKKNLICCCFFKRNNNYYKNFRRYIHGLCRMYTYVIKNIHNYSIRLFIDDSIYKDYDIINLLKEMELLEIVIFRCPKYQIGDFHQGLFGTLIRFFPMFDFPNNDADKIIISDIDDYSLRKYFDIYKKLNNKINDLYLIKFSNAGKMFKNKELYNHIYNGIILDYIKPQEIISLKRVNNNLILDFLENLNPTINYSYYLNENYKKNNSFISKFENNGCFIYGIDEYFLNNHYLHYFIDYEKPFLNILKFNMNGILYNQIYNRNEYWLDREKIIFTDFINHILYLLNINKHGNLQSKFKSIEKEIEKNDNSKKILYNLIVKIRNKKKFSFMSNSIYNNLLSQPKYKDMYNFIEYQFYFTKNMHNFFLSKL